MEQIEYKREGIKWSNIEFSDNKDCIQMIEKSNISILSLLDEATKLESSSDENFTESLKKYFGKNDKFSTTRLKKNQFSLRHFAEEVTYDVNGFREKNQNQIRPDLIGVIKVSSCEFISELFKEYLSLEEIINSNTRKFRGKTTVSTQFKRELLGLENVLNSTHSFYVRCIKPNSKQAPKQFDLEFVRKQLIYNGMLETVKIRKAGLPFRFPFTVFYNRYRKLSRLKNLPKNVDTRKACLLLVQKIGEYIIEGRYALGKTKIFLGTDQYEKLESARAEFLEKSSYIIRRAVTKWMERKEEEERKRKEEEERLRKEEEERKRKEEELRKRKEEEEKKRKEEEERKRKEQLRKKKEEEEKLKKEQEEKKKKEEEERLKRVEWESKEEEERKRKEEIRLKKEMEEEEKAKIEEERIIRKQEELRKRKEEEIKKKKEELERKKKELMSKNSQGVDNETRKQVENKILEHKTGFDKEPLSDEEIKKSLSELLQHIKKWAQLALKKTDRQFLLVPQKSIGNLVTTLYLNSPVKKLGTNLVNCVKKILACKETLYDDLTPSESKSKMLQDEIKNIVMVTKEFVEYLDKRNGTLGDSLSKSSSMDFLSKSSTNMDILKSDSTNELLNVSTGKRSVGIESKSDGSLLTKSSGLTNKSSTGIPQKNLVKNYKTPSNTIPLKNSSSSSVIITNGNKNGLAKSSNGVSVLVKNSTGVMNNNSTGLRNNSKFKDNIFLNLSKSGESENSENNLGFSLKKSLTPEVGSKTNNTEVSSSDSNISFLISPRNSKSNISGVKTQDNKKLLKDPQKSSQSHIFHQNTSAKRSEFVFRKKDSDDMDDPIIVSQKLEKEKDKENNSDVENTPVFIKKPSIRRSLSTPSLEKMMINQGGGSRESSSNVDDYPKLKHYFRDSPTFKSDITSLLQSMVHPLKGIPLSTRRNGFKIYKDTFTFQSAVEWLSKQSTFCKDKQSSVGLFVCLQQDGLVQLVLKNKKSANDDIYHFTQATTEIPSSSDQNSLEQQLERQKEKYPQLYVPRILQVLTSMIESICSKNKNTTACSNIFCQGVGEFLLLPYQKSLDNDQPLETIDPHIPSNLLKQWLWKLPKPLIPIKLIDCQKYIYLTPEDRFKYLDQLPLVNKDALSELFEFFVNCSKWENFTKVTLSEICRQFTPCLLHCKAETNKTIFECLKTCDSSEFQLIELLIKEVDPKQLRSKREILPTTSFIPNQRSERKITFLGPLIGNFPSPFTRNKSQIVIPEEHKSWLKEPDLLKSSTWSKYCCGSCGKEAPHHAFEKCASCGEAFYSINKTPLNLLFEKKIGYQYELGTHTISPDLQPIENNRLKREDIDLDCHYYRDFFFGKPHSVFMAENKTKDTAEYCCIAVENSEGKSLKVLILSKLGWKKTSIVASSKNQRIISQLNKIDFLTGFKISNIEDSESLKKVLLDYETRSIATGYKFGVLYQKEGQKIEEEMYGNVKGSVRYVQFLKLLGTVINLEGHVGFRGGLDVKNNSTGTKSIYKKMYFDEQSYLIEDKLQQKTPKEDWKTFEIMYHVSTLLPYSPENPQQLHRKRHIGNDVIVIVFKEKKEDKFDPSILASHFNHVFIVVTPHTVNEQGLATQYHIGIASKVGVKPFRPFIKQPPIYDINDDLVNLLIMKAINGERAAMYSRDFSVNLNRTRSEVLKSWFGTYK